MRFITTCCFITQASDVDIVETKLYFSILEGNFAVSDDSAGLEGIDEPFYLEDTGSKNHQFCLCQFLNYIFFYKYVKLIQGKKMGLLLLNVVKKWYVP